MISEDNFLYRGVSKDLHKKNEGKLVPKGRQFKSHLYPSEYLFPSDRLIIGESEQNAAINHQIGGQRDAGISTTPIFDRAKYYATHINDLITTDGCVYVIDRSKLGKFGIEEKIVSELVEYPKIPEDEEVILVAKDRGVLPSGIVVETMEVAP